MSKEVNVGYTDTPIGGVSSLSFPRGLVNFGADFRKKSSTQNEAIITNITSPVDRPEIVRIAYSDVANVYSGSDIDPSVYAPSKRGVSLLVHVSETFSVTDTTDPSYRVDLPISAHIVLKIPANDNLTPAHMQAVVGRLVSGLYDTGSLSTDRFKALMRGSILPSDVK